MIKGPYLVCMWRGDKKHRPRLRNPPRAPRHDFSEEEVDEIPHPVEKQVVFPVHHGIQLLLGLLLLLRLFHRLLTGLGPRLGHCSFLRSHGCRAFFVELLFLLSYRIAAAR